jgi:hypothetical protein
MPLANRSSVEFFETPPSTIMMRLTTKTAIAVTLILASMLQGMPLLVATFCNMPNSETMGRMGACCCCEDVANLAVQSFTSCMPGKTLAGILATDPSLQPVKDKNATAASPLPPAFACSILECDGGLRLKAALSFFDQDVLRHTASPPLYLLDSVYRI